MTTAADIIGRSMRLLGELGSGNTPETDEYADGLEALNAMLGVWNNEKLMCYALREETLTLASATTSYTIGPTGDLVTTRPVAIEQAWVVVSNISYHVELITDEEYAGIPDKTATSDWPDRANYKADMSNGTLYVYPVPNATQTMKLLTRTPLVSFSTTGDTVTLPPGWDDALAFNLAVRWAPEFETSPRPEVMQMAVSSKAAIKRINTRPVKFTSELTALVGAGRLAHIISDQP